MRNKLLFILIVILFSASIIYCQAKKDPKLAAIEKQITELKDELSSQRDEIANLKDQLAIVKKTSKKIFTKSLLINSYYDAVGAVLHPGGNSNAELTVDFPENYFSKKPEIMISIRGWSYTGRLTNDTSPSWEGATLQQYWPLGPNWVKATEVTQRYCKVRAFLYEKDNMLDNIFLIDVLAVGE